MELEIIKIEQFLPQSPFSENICLHKSFKQTPIQYDIDFYSGIQTDSFNSLSFSEQQVFSCFLKMTSSHQSSCLLSPVNCLCRIGFSSVAGGLITADTVCDTPHECQFQHNVILITFLKVITVNIRHPMDNEHLTQLIKRKHCHTISFAYTW